MAALIVTPLIINAVGLRAVFFIFRSAGLSGIAAWQLLVRDRYILPRCGRTRALGCSGGSAAAVVGSVVGSVAEGFGVAPVEAEASSEADAGAGEEVDAILDV